ncbi:GNAT family N-acetyltransferase [Colwellia sp. MEBiC06753]
MITTKRMTLRPLIQNDWPFIIDLLNQADFINNIGDKQVRTQQDALDYITNGPAKMQETYGFSLMAMVLPSGEQIGLCGLLKRDELPSPDLGYALLPQHYRQGYTKEAAQAVLSHYQKIRPVLAITSEDNLASQQLLQGLGFAGFEDPRITENYPDGISAFIYR